MNNAGYDTALSCLSFTEYLMSHMPYALGFAVFLAVQAALFRMLIWEIMK